MRMGVNVMDKQSLLNSLSKTQYFLGLDTQKLEKVVAIGNVRDFPRHQLILRESDIGSSVLLVLAGRVEITVSLVGGQRTETIATLSDGEIVGEMILLGRNRRTANVVAKDDCTLFEFRAADLLQLFDADQQIGYVVMRNIARQMSERLAAVNQVLRNALGAY